MKSTILLFLFLSLQLLIKDASLSAQNIPDFLVNEQTSPDGSEQSYPSIDGDGQGNYVITWMDDRNGTDDNILAQIFQNDSTPLSNIIIVNDDTGTAPQYQPDVAVDPNLNFVITWLDRRNGFVWDVYAQRYSGDGTPLGSNFKVNEEPGNEEQEDPTVSIDSVGNFVIVWTDEKSGDWDIYGQRYSYDGTALGGNFKINDDTGIESQYWPTSKGEKNGNFIVSWVDQRQNDDWDIYAQQFLADGTALGNNFKVNTDAGLSTQLHPDITIEENGNFIIAWEDERNGDWDIYAQRYLNDGTTVGDNFKINDNTPNSDQRHPSITIDPAGNFTVCWGDDRTDYEDIYAQRFNYNAIPIGENFLVNMDTVNSYHHEPMISIDEDGNFIIIWEDHRFGFNGDIYAQRYLSDGTAVGDNFRVIDDTSDGNQTGPSIAKDSNDNFIIAWNDSRNYSFDVYTQLFSSNGTALGDIILVNDEDQNYANYGGPSISADEDGNFVVAWVDYRYEYWGEIYAQRFSSDGIALGANFKVNYLGAWMIYGATVTCQKNGDFIIIWGDSEDGGKHLLKSQHINEQKSLPDGLKVENKNSQPDIWAQLYLSDGTPLGDNFKVNDDESDTDQTNPAIAVDSTGNFIIAWNDNRNGSWDIYSQRYLSDGTAIDSNIRIVESLNVTYPALPSLSSDKYGNFIISWIDNQNEDYDLWARQFSYNCLPTGDIFLVNDDNGSNYQSSPCVSADKDGKFIITWMDIRNGTRDVYAQRYLSDGEPLGSNYQITNTDELSQQSPSVILDNNRIYSTWQDNRGGQSGHDIWANVYDWDSWVGIDEELLVDIPSDQHLSQNYPNPFSSFTRISYELDEPDFITLYIYDQQGKKIKSMINEVKLVGSHSLIFDGSNLESGVYFYNLKVGNKNYETRKMILMR